MIIIFGCIAISLLLWIGAFLMVASFGAYNVERRLSLILFYLSLACFVLVGGVLGGILWQM